VWQVLPSTATGAAYVYSRDYTQDFIYLVCFIYLVNVAQKTGKARFWPWLSGTSPQTL